MAAKTRRPIRWARLLPIVLCVTGACAQDKAPDASGRVPVHLETLEVDAGRTWSADVAVPAFTADEAPVLSLRARLQTKHPGGCNYVLQILLAGRALTEDPMRPRLVNKAPWFDPPDTGYHFSWYGPREKGWMTIFSPGFEGDWGAPGVISTSGSTCRASSRRVRHYPLRSGTSTRTSPPRWVSPGRP